MQYTATIGEADVQRLTDLVWRMNHGQMYRISGVTVMILVAGAVVISLAWLMGGWRAWMILITIPLVIVFGGIGEAIGRSIEERNATDREITFARYLIWKEMGGLQRWLQEEPQLWRPWLECMAQYSSDAAIATVAREALRLADERTG